MRLAASAAPLRIHRYRGLTLLVAITALGCQKLDRFDTSEGDAYCGRLVDAQFVWTAPGAGGFDRLLRMRVDINTAELHREPVHITTDDAVDGPCEPDPTFDAAPLRVVPEIAEDPLSTMTFSEAQEHNIIGWTRSGCRGPILTIVSLLKSDDVEVRLLKPALDPIPSGQRDAFALFHLNRSRDCGF